MLNRSNSRMECLHLVAIYHPICMWSTFEIKEFLVPSWANVTAKHDNEFAWEKRVCIPFRVTLQIDYLSSIKRCRIHEYI